MAVKNSNPKKDNMHLEFLVEELSAEMVLHNLLPKIITGEHTYKVITFQGKQDLLKKLKMELRAYKRWISKEFKIIVLVDRDNQDCCELKRYLDVCAEEAGLITKSQAAADNSFTVVNRIAIEELEAWYFGDPDAVRAAYPRVSASIRHKAPYRIPDSIAGGTFEALERLLKAKGYFKNGLRKTELARNISIHMEPMRNRSKSFQIFWQGITDIISNN
jgi:hypothetical protein